MMFKRCLFLISVICTALVLYKLQTHEDNVADNSLIIDSISAKAGVQKDHPTSASIEPDAESLALAAANSETTDQRTSVITLSQLNEWVYQGNNSDKWRAMSYLFEFEDAAVPLLLNLIHGKNELALKEQAITLLADINPILMSSLFATLNANDQLMPIISTLSINNQLSSLNDYEIGLSDFKNTQTTSLINELMTDNESLKVSAIEQVSWANFTELKEVLNWVILHDKSSSVRQAAIKAGLTFDNEHQHEWIKKGLHDIDPNVQAFALKQIQSSGIEIDLFMADFIAILYSNSDKKTSDEVVELLSYESMPLASEILTQIKSN